MTQEESGGRRPGHHHRGRSTAAFIDKSRMLAALPLHAGQVVVDAGCGNGYMSRMFSEAVGVDGTVYALDPDAEAVNRLRQEVGESNIEAMVSDVTRSLPLPADAVDLIYISAVIHGFSPEQLRAFLQEAGRVLKPGAMLAVVEIVKQKTPFGPPLEIRFSPEELREIVGWKALPVLPAGEYFYLQRFQKEE